jgi:hypothetical protein
VLAKTEVERQFDADVYLWGPDGKPEGWDGQQAGAYVDLRTIAGRVERVSTAEQKWLDMMEVGEAYGDVSDGFNASPASPSDASNQVASPNVLAPVPPHIRWCCRTPGR